MKTLETHPIKDYCLGIFDGPHATPKELEVGPIFLGIKNITDDGRLDLTEIRHVSDEEFPRWTKRVTPRNGDVVLTYEATLHRYAVIPEGFDGCLGRRVALMRPDPTKVDSRYLLYYFLSFEWRRVVESSIINGATVDRLPLEKLPDFPVRLPELDAQKKIVSTLAAYDDHIANDRRRIELLEQSARLLFKEWFVQLRYPGHKHDEITDGVPYGWGMKPLGEIVVEVKEKVHPTDVEPSTPYIGLEHIPRRSTTILDWGRADDVSSDKYRFGGGDILFAKIRPYFHKVGFALVDGITSSDAVVVRSRASVYYNFVLHLLSSDEFIAITSKTVREGSKMPRADWGYLMQRKVLVPPPALIADFNDFIHPIVGQLRNFAIQARKLSAARELLLPRLMDGRIKV